MNSGDVCAFSCVRLFVTPRIVAHQAPLSMECSRQNYWSGLPFPTLGIFLTQGSLAWVSYIGKQILYHCTVWEARLLGYARIRPPKCAPLLRASHSKSSFSAILSFMSPDLSPLSFREPLSRESFFCLGYLFTDLSIYSNLYLISTYYVSIIVPVVPRCF